MKQIHYIFLLISCFTFSQEIKLLKGKLSTETEYLSNVTILNKTRDLSTNTDAFGYFKIKAASNDEIIVSSLNLKTKKIILTEKQLLDELLIIKMEVNSKYIKEVFITNKDNINAESLGLVPKGQKILTPAERRYKQASEFVDLNQGLNLSIDAVINQISGRSKQLKKDILVERKEMIQDKMLLNYEKDFFVNQYKIPEEYVEGFLFYIVEDQSFLDAYKAKNKVLMQFRMSELATKFLELKNIVPLEKTEIKNDTLQLEKK